MDAVNALAAPRGIHVIEDAAQALGASYQGRPAGSLGTVGCFSFFPTKNLGAFGDAGLVSTTDAAVARRVALLRNHGAEPKYYHAEIGGNFRMDALQAAVLRVKLPHLAGWNARRQANARTYDMLFREAGLAGRIGLPSAPAGRTHIYHQYVIRVPDRDGMRAHLAAAGVGTEVYYPVPFHRQACFASLDVNRDAFPQADAAAADVLALPIYPELSHDQQAYVVRCIAERLA